MMMMTAFTVAMNQKENCDRTSLYCVCLKICELSANVEGFTVSYALHRYVKVEWVSLTAVLSSTLTSYRPG